MIPRFVLTASFAMAAILTGSGTAGQPQKGSCLLSGTVLSVDEQRPVRRAIVSVSGPPGVRRAAITDDDGRFSIEGFPAGRLTISVTKPAYLWRPDGPSGIFAVDVAAGQRLEGLALWLRKGAALSGIVLDQSGAPVHGAVVKLLRGSAFGDFASVTRKALTDDRGYYRLFGLDPGEYIVYASHSYAAVASDVAAPSGAELDVLLSTSSTTLNARPAPAVVARRMTLVPVYYPGTLDAAAAARLLLTYGDDRSEVNIPLVAARSATIEGRVHAEGAGDIVLFLTKRGPVAPESAAQTARHEPDGRFVFPGVTPGSYVILARSRRPPGPGQPELWGRANIEVAGADVIGIDLPLQATFQIKGRILADGPISSGGFDLRRVRISAINTTEEPLRAHIASGLVPNVLPAGASPARDGTFTLSGLAAGEHYVTITRLPVGLSVRAVTFDSDQALGGPIIVPVGNPSAVLTVYLSDRATTLSGTVDPKLATPGRGAVRVIAFPVAASLRSIGSARVKMTALDSAGRYLFTDLPAGEYYVSAVQGIASVNDLSPMVLDELSGRSVRIALQHGHAHIRDIPEIVAR